MLKNGDSCREDAWCKSGHCVEGECKNCGVNADCGAYAVCANGSRFLGPSGGPFCFTADAGCASASAKCPDGFECHACDAGFACNDSTGECYSTAPPPPPICGQADLSNGYDAGTGPGPDVSGKVCDSCIGCPLGSSCVCGISGQVGGLRCQYSDPGAALACFVTGGVGTCQIFPGDCATNSQCSGSTPFCNQRGSCVACLRDVDCPQEDGGAHGCINGTCSPCCTADVQCGSGHHCTMGFCYEGAPDAGADGGPDGGADAGTDAGTDGGM